MREKGSIPEKTAIRLISELCEGISALHQKGIIHKDLQPRNVIISDTSHSDISHSDISHIEEKEIGLTGSLKLIDFGIAENYSPEKEFASEFGGTAGFRAPETNDGISSPASDILSLGCLLNFMLTGADPSLKKYKGSRNLEDILWKATAPDPYSRYRTAKYLRNALLHELRTVFPDNIPVIRSVPGYRSHSFIHASLATIYYCFMSYLFIDLAWGGKAVWIPALMLFWLVLPLMLAFDPLGLLHFLPDKFRKNWVRLFYVRAFLIAICIIAGMVLVVVM